MKDPQTLEEAIEVAEQVRTRKYYKKNTSEDDKAQERKLASEIDLLSQKMQQMSLNYASLTSAIVSKDDYNTKRSPPRPNTWTEGPENHRCYTCGEKGHLARSCRNRRTSWSGPSNPSGREDKRVNMAWVNTGGDYSSDEEQVYAGTRERPKPYDINRKGLKERRTESQKEFNLRSRQSWTLCK